MVNAQYRLQLLGSFRLERDGIEVKLPRRKSEALLAYLALYPQEHAREKIATVFWGDYPEENARRSLRQALSPLRQALGENALLGDYETIQLNPDLDLRADVPALYALLDTERELYAHENHAAALLDIPSFELLPDFYDDWLETARKQLFDTVTRAALHLIEKARTQSDYPTALALVQVVLNIDPANETAHQHAMFCYSALGDRTAALAQYEKLKRALREELGVEPSPETHALYTKLSAQPPARSAAARLTNLPVPASSFIGREKELNALGTLLRGGATLVTLLGPGGSGKTRLAIEVGTQLIDEFPDGVWWVDLTAITDDIVVPLHVAKALGAQVAAGEDALQALGEFLEDKRLLLALDNCEHLVAASAALVNALVPGLPGIAILATSREALNVAGEQVYPVAPLSVPNATLQVMAAALLDFDAIRLFVERARKINPAFVLNDVNAHAIAQICTRLDGIPLAIELAAARVRHVDVQEIAARLQDRFQFLTGGSRTAMPRQQTLRALIDWSYNLLDAQEQVLFRRLAVFEGGWTLEAAELVCGAGALAVMDVLGRLVDKSLVVFEANQGRGRYRFLETIREYAKARLAATGEAGLMQKAHLEYFFSLAEKGGPELQSPQQAHWLARLDEDWENLRTALDFGLEQKDAGLGFRLVAVLGEYWKFRQYIKEGTRYTALVLARQAQGMDDDLLGRIYTIAGSMAWQSGEAKNAIAMHTLALEHFRNGGNLLGMGVALKNLGANYQISKESERALECYSRAQEIAEQLEHIPLEMSVHINLGYLMQELEDYKAAKHHYARSLELAQHEQNIYYVVMALHNLGCVARYQGEYERALALFDESIQSSHQVHLNHNLAGNHLEKGYLLMGWQRWAEARRELQVGIEWAIKGGEKAWLTRLYGAMAVWYERNNRAENGVRLLAGADRLREQTGQSWEFQEAREITSSREGMRQTLGEARFEVSWGAGQALSPAQLLKLSSEG